MIGEDHTIPVDRAPGSIPCDHCLDHLEERLTFGLIGSEDETASSPAQVWIRWAAFRDNPGQRTWREFVYRLRLLLDGDGTRRVLGDIDPWPDATESEMISADDFWSAPDFGD